MKLDENAYLVEEDYLVTCWENPELIETELRRFEARWSILKRKTMAGYAVLAIAALAVLFVNNNVILIPIALTVLNLVILDAQSRRLMQLRQMLVFVQQRSRDERAGAPG